MPKSWIPYRGDDYSKENSKRYIPKPIPEYTRIFGGIVLTASVVITIYAIITDLSANKDGISIFALAAILVVILISIKMFRDTKKTSNNRSKKSVNK